jgi:hypothetical protein
VLALAAVPVGVSCLFWPPGWARDEESGGMGEGVEGVSPGDEDGDVVGLVLVDGSACGSCAEAAAGREPDQAHEQRHGEQGRAPSTATARERRRNGRV